MANVLQQSNLILTEEDKDDGRTYQNYGYLPDWKTFKKSLREYPNSGT